MQTEIGSYLQQNYKRMIMDFSIIREWSKNGFLVYNHDLRRFFIDTVKFFEPHEPGYKLWKENLTIFLSASNFNIDRDAQDNHIQRFEFMEILVRIAIYKYIKHGTETSSMVAMRRLVNEIIEPQLKEEELRVWGSHEWRKTMQTEPVNNVLYLNKHLLQELHSKYSCRLGRPEFAKPGEFIIEDALLIFSDAKIRNMKGSLYLCFAASK